VVGAIAYARIGRPWVLDWGAIDDEKRRPLPGDDILESVADQTTRAITIDAPPDAIWPWLLQMGPRPRAGVYTYDWLERAFGLDIENSDRIMPEHQHLDPGDEWELNKSTSIVVRDVQPDRAIVLQWEPARSTWAFVLQPDGDHTRLISRNRLPYTGPAFWPMALVMEPGSLVMERKMLLGIKERAEHLHHGATTASIPG
jgi:hypothetical protein